MKKILITGCTKGLGYALTLEFAKRGFYVFSVGRDSKKLNELASLSSRIEVICADIATSCGRNLIVNAIKNDSISIIHNAAILYPEQFARMAEDSFRLQHEVNYLAPLLLTQQLLPVLKGQRVLHISSGAAEIALPGLLPYCVTKAAVEKAVNCLNAELNPQEIYFSSLRPGMIDTPMQLQLRTSNNKDLPGRQFYIDAKQLNQLVSPEKVAEFVFFVMAKTENKIFTDSSWRYPDCTS